MKGEASKAAAATGTERRVGGDRRWDSVETSTHSGWKGPLLGFEWRETDLTDILPWQRATCGPGGDDGPPDHGAAVGRMKSDHSPGRTLNSEPGMFPNP